MGYRKIYDNNQIFRLTVSCLECGNMESIRQQMTLFQLNLNPALTRAMIGNYCFISASIEWKTS
jgi:hypothetical protein